MLRARKSFILLLFITFFSAIYRTVLTLHEGFPPGADIGLHNSLIHSITQGGNINFLYNHYHMGGGSSITFPGFDIFVCNIVFFSGLPDYLAQAFVAILFSSLIVLVAFLITRKIFNQPIALIVAFLVGVSYYDIYMLLWSGYANIVTLMLIPLTFYLLLEKPRFQRLPRITVASLLSAAILLAHSLSALMFIAIVFVTVFIALCSPRRLGVGRKDALEWLVPLFIGGLAVSPFLAQAAPFYLNLNSPVYTGGLPEIQKTLLYIRLVPFEYVLPFFVCFFLYFVFSKYMHVKTQLSMILLVSWLIISTALTQSHLLGFYTDYERFLYFAALPLIIFAGTGIYLGARLLAKNTNGFLSPKISLLQKRSVENKVLRHLKSYPSNQTTVTLFAIILVVIAFFGLPHLSITPSDGFRMQGQQQVMTHSGYEAIQWINNYTPANSVFVADALYGWWLGGAQRPTVSAVEPFFITNSREFEPALLATRLLDTDYLVDNGLIQVREDGGYMAGRNPEFLAKLSNSYYPFPFLSFNNSQTSITFSKSGELNIVKLSEVPVREMYVERSSASTAICVVWGNELLNFTQKTTVYQGVRFVNMSETISSSNPTISFVNMRFIVQTRGNVATRNDSSIGLVDPYVNVAGQLIFTGAQPTVTQAPEAPLEIQFDLEAQSGIGINFYVAAFEYPNLDSESTTKSALRELFMNNTRNYADKAAAFPLDIFDYQQAITDLDASYIAVREPSKVSKFLKDPMFNLLFVNEDVAIFQIDRAKDKAD